MRSTVTSEGGSGEHRLLLDARDPPELDVALTIGLLGVDDRDVGAQRRDRRELLAGEWAGDRPDLGALRQIGPPVAAHNPEREVSRSGGVTIRHPGMGVLGDLDRPRPPVLDRIPEAVKRTDPRIAPVGEDQLASHAHPDHLVVEDIRGHPDQLQLGALLAQHLVTGGERDQVGKSFERHAVAIVDELSDGVFDRNQVSHECVRYANSCPPCAQLI